MTELAFSSNKELGHICIYISLRYAWKAQTFQGWPKSSPIGCVAYNFTLNNNLTSSRTFGDQNYDGSHKMFLTQAQSMLKVLMTNKHVFRRH